MSDSLLVLIVSKETIPNVQFLKWYFRNNAKKADLLFVSSEKMENDGKSDAILNACQSLSENFGTHNIIRVSENDLQEISNKLCDCLKDCDHKEYIVNITGGTKLMSLAVYEYFHNKQNAMIFYQPMDKDLQKIYPEYGNCDVYGYLTIDEYMKAHGIEYKKDNKCIKSYEYNKDVLNTIVINNKDTVQLLLTIQNDRYFINKFKHQYVNFPSVLDEYIKTSKDPKIDNASRDKIIDFIKLFDFDVEHLSKNELRYITGGWFEEYVFQRTMYTENLSEDKIALNMHIEEASDKNELDVVYLDKSDKLNVIECKSFAEGNETNKILNEALYKLQAIMKSKFGLGANSYLYTKSIITTDSVLKRAKNFRIKIIDGNQLND